MYTQWRISITQTLKTQQIDGKIVIVFPIPKYSAYAFDFGYTHYKINAGL